MMNYMVCITKFQYHKKKQDFCVSKICKLYDKWRSIKKTQKTFPKATIENFQNELNKMCDLLGKQYKKKSNNR